MRNEKMKDVGMDKDVWAKLVVGDLMKRKPPAVIWRGANAMMGRIGTFFPHGMADGMMKKLTGLDVVEEMVGKK